MFMCVVNLKLVNKLDLTWKQSFLIITTVKSFITLAPDGITNPKYKLLHFLMTIFLQREEGASF